jgi:hypothetical protein
MGPRSRHPGIEAGEAGESMNLYVWVDPYEVSYGSSLAFAIAPSEDAARKILCSGVKSKAFSYGNCTNGFPNDEWMETIKGPPTRVVPIGRGVGEWHEWSE